MSLLERIFQEFPEYKLKCGATLREIEPTQDAPAYFDLLNHPSVTPYIPDGCIPKDTAMAEKTLTMMRKLFRDKNSCYWGIADSRTNQLIGTCGFESWLRFHNRAELVYELHPNYWRQGIMTEALFTIRFHAFQVMKVNRIDAFTITNNNPSIELLKKAGFKHEGVLRKYRFYKGRYVDIMIFSSLFADRINQMPLTRQLDSTQKAKKK